MDLESVREWIAEARSIVGFSGAGVSTESGIPDFRSPNGFWARNRIVEFDEFVNNRESRIEYWRQKCASWPDIRDAEPNAGHKAFVRLHDSGRLAAMITQNIDGLHQKAGLPRRAVYEIHGTTVESACLSCDYREPSEVSCRRVSEGDPAPECPACGGLLKPATISFGQTMPHEVLQAAERHARKCDLFLAVGSSLVVYPAALLPAVAKRAGARLVIVNRDPTPLDDIADCVLNGQIGEVLPALVGSAT